MQVQKKAHMWALNWNDFKHIVQRLNEMLAASSVV